MTLQVPPPGRSPGAKPGRRGK